MRENARILVISDAHFPFNHGDIIAFLRELKKEYKPTRVVCMGDEIDWHSISFHDHDPDLMSPADELTTAINRLRPLYELFPKMELVESNHGSLVYRKQKAHGLPRYVIKSYREIIEAPRGWRWHPELVLKLPDKSHCLFHHARAADVTRASKALGMSVVQGHYHEKMKLEFWATPTGKVYFGLQTGCLIEPSSLAFAYSRNNLGYQAIGTAVIVDSMPRLHPMVMNEKGRWRGSL